MRKIGLILMAVMLSFNASASEIKGEDLQLSAEQNQKLIELKNNLKEEVRPVLEEIIHATYSTIKSLVWTARAGTTLRSLP